MLNTADSIRYSRLLSLDGFTETHMNKIRDARVLVVGAGALGSVVAAYLVAGGIGTVGIVDFDTVDISNLQRQVFYTTDSVGKRKVEELVLHLTRQNPEVKIDRYNIFLHDDSNSRAIIAKYDVIAECTDNPSSKLLVESLSLEAGKPVVIGGVSQMSGQIMISMRGHTTFRDIFGESPGCNGFTPCSSGGVLGPVAGIVASIQATEVLKIVTGIGRPLFDRMLTIDTRTMSLKTWDLT